jgi:hypothetical protein
MIHQNTGTLNTALVLGQENFISLFNMLWTLSFLLLSQISATKVIPHNYPYYSQCDSRWKNEVMQTKTICSVGCLLASTAMGLAGKGISIPSSSGTNSTSDPHTLNVWLQKNNGYADYNNLIEGDVPHIYPAHIVWPADGFQTTNTLPFKTICSYIDAGRVVVANVNEGQHFVLLIGYDNQDGTTFYVNDPGYAKTTYSYKTDVVGYRIYDMYPETPSFPYPVSK